MKAKALMTMEQFLDLSEQEAQRYELWQGELIDVGETTIRHNWIREKLIFCLTGFLLETKLGVVFAETGVQFDTNTLARPDVVYWDNQHFATIGWDSSPVQVIPQLVAEVVSPSNSLRQLFRNAEYYIRTGVQVVWVVDRDPVEIHVFEKGKPKRIVRVGEMLEAPSVLPGFSENVSRFVPPA